MVVNVNYDDVKVQINDLIEAAMRGDKVIITKDGRQVVQLLPLKTKRKPPKFGSAKGKIKFAPDFDAPLADFDEYMP